MAGRGSQVRRRREVAMNVVPRASRERDGVVDVIGMLRAAQAGDDRACEQLFVSIRPYALRVADAFLRNVPTAAIVGEDVAQESLLRAYVSLESCRAETSGQVLAWIRVITQRLATEVMRAHAFRVSLAGVELLESSACSDDTTPSGDNEFSNGEQRFLERLTFEAYAALGDSSAEALWMHLICSASWEEAGRALDITAAAAKRRFQRAQIAIRRRVIRRAGELSASDRALVESRSAGLR